MWIVIVEDLHLQIGFHKISILRGSNNTLGLNFWWLIVCLSKNIFDFSWRSVNFQNRGTIENISLGTETLNISPRDHSTVWDDSWGILQGLRNLGLGSTKSIRRVTKRSHSWSNYLYIKEQTVILLQKVLRAYREKCTVKDKGNFDVSSFKRNHIAFRPSNLFHFAYLLRTTQMS